MEDIAPYAWLDDRIVARDALLVAGDDPGLTRADGIFETMRVVDGVVQAQAEHLARFERSRIALALPPPPTDPAVAIAAVLAANAEPGPAAAPHREHSMRLTLTARPTLLVTQRAIGASDRARRAGLALHTLPARRGESFIARHKTLAWNANAVQRRLHPVGSLPDFEGLWLDPHDLVLEGTSTNLFAVIDGVVRTAPTHAAILPGISRARVLRALAHIGIEAHEHAFTRAELGAAEEVFATNALLPIAPVVSIDGSRIYERPSLAREPLVSILLGALG